MVITLYSITGQEGIGMTGYHLRRQDKAMDEAGIQDVIEKCVHLTLALSKDGEPYLATMNYGYDEAEQCFYFHCASEGKKVDYIRANPSVWGQVIEDMGYIMGECDHGYRTVQFAGMAEMVDDIDEKRVAICLMIDQLEDEPDDRKAKLTDEKLEKVGILRVQALGFSGKMNVPE